MCKLSIGGVMAFLGVGCAPAIVTSARPLLHDVGVAVSTTACDARLYAAVGHTLVPLHSAHPAFDGDPCTVWNARSYPPAEVEVDIAQAHGFDGLLLVPEMTPRNADVTHVFETSSDDVTYDLLATVQQSMTSGRVYTICFGAPVEARHLRVRTTASPSWVAWRDILPVRCGQ